MALPTPCTVQHARYRPTGPNAHGNLLDAWDDPVDVAVHAIAPAGSAESAETGRSALTTGLDVYAPAGTTVGARDRVTVDGDLYEVDGDPADFSRGPWHFAAGVVIRLRRVEG